MNMPGLFRPLAGIIIALSVTGFFAGEASARPAICGKLERQLASAGSGSGSNRYSNAASAQSKQLQIARSQARRAGCGGSFLGFGSGGDRATCAKLTGTIRKMEANLIRLQSKAGGQSSDLSKSRIRAALEANDCYGGGAQIQSVSAKRTLPEPVNGKRRSLFSEIFGGEIKQLPAEDRADNGSVTRKVRVVNGNGEGRGGSEYFGGGGTYRTLCVRTCDGYYFPVSFSTTSSHFADDEKACAAMCPGAETKLYFHSVPDQEPEEMVNQSKEPYTALPTAFKYRVEGLGKVPGCSCQAAQAAGDPALTDPINGKKPRWIPVPTPKPSLIEGPETALNRIGGLDAAAIAALIEGKTQIGTLEAQRKVRVVGPAFLPDPSTAATLPVPARVSVQ